MILYLSGVSTTTEPIDLHLGGNSSFIPNRFFAAATTAVSLRKTSANPNIVLNFNANCNNHVNIYDGHFNYGFGLLYRCQHVTAQVVLRGSPTMVPTNDGSATFGNQEGNFASASGTPTGTPSTSNNSPMSGVAPNVNQAAQFNITPFTNDPSFYQIKDVATGKCWDVNQSHGNKYPKIGTMIVQYTCHSLYGTSQDSQAFTGNKSGQIINGSTNRCVDVAYNTLNHNDPSYEANKGQLKISNCISSNPSQIWTQNTFLTPVFIRRFTQLSGTANGATNLQIDAPYNLNGAQIVMYPTLHANDKQLWNPIDNGDGTLTFISNYNKAKCIDIYYQKMTAGTSLVQHDCHETSDSTDSQRWINIGNIGKAQYMSAKSLATDSKGNLISHTPMCIQAGGLNSADAESRKNYASVIIAPCSNSDQQMFTIVGN